MGTGKEVVARCAHQLKHGEGKSKPFVAVNCAGIPEGLLEGELFGIVGGFVSGVPHTKRGAFERAKDGTVFLDEIGELRPALQAKLLRVLQDGSYAPLGWQKAEEKKTEARIIAATNRDLNRLMGDRKFQPDLYYHLTRMQIHVWPLYARPGDLAILAYYFIKRYNKEVGGTTHSIKTVDHWLIQQIMHHRWRGNVRELDSLITRNCLQAKYRKKTKDCLTRVQTHCGFSHGVFLQEGSHRRPIIHDCARSSRGAASP